MKIKLVLVISLSFLIIFYLGLPSPEFPPPPPGAYISSEPADTESTYRRGYYTNFTREEIMAFYDKHFPGLIKYRLNYPPEEAFVLIRDQTYSSFLEEIVHPWKQSLYVSGYFPALPNEAISRDGVLYQNKVNVRYVPSNMPTRLTTLLLTGVAVYLLAKEYVRL